MQSLKARIGNRRGEFLEYVGDYGRGEAMDAFGIRDYIALQRLLVEWTHDENFGVRPRIGRDDKQLFETLRDKIRYYNEQNRKRISEMATEHQRLKAENDMLRQMIRDKFGYIIKGLIEELEQ